jgi:hypothetical protein
MNLDLPQKNSVRQVIHSFAGRPVRLGLSLALLMGLAASASGWNTLSLPDLVSSSPHFGALAITHFADGRFLYGNNNQLYTQEVFGAANVTALAVASGDGVDPSFLAVLGGKVAVAGAGMFGNSSLYQFNPTNADAPDYSAITTMQNFSGVMRNASSLYVAGANGSGGANAVSYVNLNGTTQLLVDQVSTFSAGLARDTAGDLFVGDDDTASVYEFTAAQLQKAIASHTTLTLANGKLVHTFADDVVDSLAVDAQGRIWAAGFGADGLFWWDPVRSIGGVLTPEAADGAYTVSTFSRSGSNYLSYVWQAGFSPGDTVLYAYSVTGTVLVPVISQQPTPVTTLKGQTAIFSVTATSPAPLTQTYAWQRNNVPLRNVPGVSGAKSATLTLSNVTSVEAGQYRVVITNAEGAVVSNVVKLTVSARR